ncbi:hypothetical protein CGZ95_08930 [Enemella evansiae]|uniref:relaxase/mobilization nuclease domain-containing protein n=1 Tax=Enemella evansiae TaxID=2016499 RepID=UPI000B962499|nr:relaxase/mobilization nuclease domain-containing protein [Enemella evansiae]OYO00736.1 hypothetical protein CGZ95_08930 [Enemella evansiae]
MANITSQSTRTSGRAQNYAKKDAVAISAVNASVLMFEQRLAEVRAAHGKDGLRPKLVVDEKGKPVRDENGERLVATDARGRPIYEAKYVEAYSLVQSFGHDELDPDDPDSWTRANELGRALAEDRFPGHPTLIATEVSGRSGCVHNHLIVGAIHPGTGKSIDSNVVTHSRLALAHDRVLAEQGFEQRADMKARALAAAAEIEARRAEVIAAAGQDLSPSELNRRLIAAENSVRLGTSEDRSVTEERETKRLREFDRYRLNEQDRQAALEIGVAPPPEKFSEIELESRITDTINDPRATSWEALEDIARDNRITIAPRGENDITYGMALAQPDGTIVEPSRAHRRRGGVPGSGKGLGDGFRRKDVEKAIGRNRGVEVRADRRREMDDAARHLQQLWDDGVFDVEVESVSPSSPAPTTQGKSPAVDEPSVSSAPAVKAENSGASVEQPEPDTPVPAHRSDLRDLSSKSPQRRERYARLAELEERWHGRLPSTPDERREFEQQVAAIGVGPSVLKPTEGHMNPELHAYLTLRAEHAQRGRDSVDRIKALRASIDEIRSGNDHRRAGELRQARRDLKFERGYAERVRDDHSAGVYTSREHERVQYGLEEVQAKRERIDAKKKEVLSAYEQVTRARESRAGHDQGYDR